MKNSVIKRYIVQILIYSVCYIFVIFLLDYVFNGMVIDFLFTNLPTKTYYDITNNRGVLTLFGYLTGLLIISGIYVFKLGKLLKIASISISQNQPSILTEKCPEELLEFSQKLKEFKFELKENERARELAEQQKNDLIVYLAHDLKTPLTSVIGYLSLLKEAHDLPLEQRAKYTGIAIDKAYRLEQLINEFFDITRLNLHSIQTEKSKFNLTVLLVQIINEFYPMFEEKNISVIQHIDSDLHIYADSDKLARVFDNLFRNAVNYSYNDSDIICTAQKKDTYISVKISNIGPDIPKEKLERIFDKFYRADTSRNSSTGGSGLGLAIAKQIIELHNGNINAVCTDGKTEFTVKLPM